MPAGNPTRGLNPANLFSDSMNFDDIRRLTITALFADDELFDQLVLKGGNALSLVYGLSSRTSLDLDFSMQNDFPDKDEARDRIFRTLKTRFESAGYTVFDEKLETKPDLRGAEDKKPWWGGYQLKFKLIANDMYTQWREQLGKMRVNSLVTGPKEGRTFTVDFSKNEYTQGKVQRQLDHYTIYVYTPQMIVIEKLRALCQQLPAYPHRGKSTPRARDFYDIHRVITSLNINLRDPENVELLNHIFDAKKVPLSLLDEIDGTRDFHRLDWEDVKGTVTGNLEDFDFYFDFVITQILNLKTLWIKEPPL
jgi:hypothetical protein